MKPTPMERLKALISDEPSREGFHKILSLLDKWKKKDGRDEALSFANEELAPWPNKMRVDDKGLSWPRFPKGKPSPIFSVVRAFHVFVGPGEEDAVHMAKAIAKEPAMAGLLFLRLYFGPTGDEGTKAIANSPYLANLTSLTILDAKMGTEGLTAIAQSPHLTHLTTLEISDSPAIGWKGVEPLAQSPQFASLTTLKLRNCGLCTDAVRSIAASPHLCQLTTLDLSSNDLDDEAMGLLAGGSCLAGLRHLFLNYGLIGSDGIAALASSPFLCKLETLELFSHKVGDAGVEMIADAAQLQTLTCLKLSCNDVGLRGAKAIARSSYMSRLTELDLGSTFWYGEEGAFALGFSPHLQSSLRAKSLEDLTKQQLLGEAKKRKIKGRTKMDAKELIAIFLTLQDEEEAHAVSPNQEDMVQLRYLLGEPPSLGTFALVLELFERWSHPDTLEVALAYAEEHLTSWPDHIRALPERRYWADEQREAVYPFFSLVRSLTVKYLDFASWEAFQRLAHAPEIEHITHLHLCMNQGWSSDSVTVAYPRLFLNNPRLQSLTSLNLSGSLCGKSELLELAQAPHMANITSLNLFGVPMGDEGAEAIAQSPYLTQLTKLVLRSCSMSTEGVMALLQSANVAQIEELDLSYNSLTLEQWSLCLDAGQLSHLKRLTWVAGSPFAERIEVLVNMPFVANLTHLTLGKITLSDEDCQVIASSPYLAQLAFLQFDEESLSREGMQTLALSPTLALGIRQKCIEKLTKKELQAIAKEKQLQGRSKMSKEQLIEQVVPM